MKSILQNIISFRCVTGLHIHYTGAEKFDISLCVLEKKKNSVHSQLFRKLEYKELDQLSEIIPKDSAIALTVSGSGVLNKEFTVQNREVNLQRFYPENKREDFYCYETEFQSGIGMSICRTDLLNKILNDERLHNYSIINIDLGVYSASVLWEMNLLDSGQIPLKQGILKRDNSSNSFIYKADEKSEINSITIGDEQVQEQYILAYITAFKVLLGIATGDFIDNKPSGINSDAGYKKIINQTKYYVLGFFLLILSINFLVYESYRKKETGIQEQLKLNNGVLMQRDSLRTVLKAKEDFIKYIGNNQTWYSIMLDELASTVPKEIKLNSLEINPLLEKVKKGNPIELHKKIMVTGSARNTLILNQWEQRLGQIDWIKEAAVISYAQSKDNNRGEFLVELTLVQ